MARAYNLNIHISLGPDMQRFFEATSPYLTWAVLASLGVMMTFTALTSDAMGLHQHNGIEPTICRRRHDSPRQPVGNIKRVLPILVAQIAVIKGNHTHQPFAGFSACLTHHTPGPQRHTRTKGHATTWQRI